MVCYFERHSYWQCLQFVLSFLELLEHQSWLRDWIWPKKRKMNFSGMSKIINPKAWLKNNYFGSFKVQKYLEHFIFYSFLVSERILKNKQQTTIIPLDSSADCTIFKSKKKSVVEFTINILLFPHTKCFNSHYPINSLQLLQKAGITISFWQLGK